MFVKIEFREHGSVQEVAFDFRTFTTDAIHNGVLLNGIVEVVAFVANGGGYSGVNSFI